jgi:aspartate/methionine/tyrosine aminotransferase
MIDLHDKVDELSILRKKYQEYLQMDLNLDMTRGKPGSEQLDLSSEILDIVDNQDFGVGSKDYRNYSVPDLLSGIPECKEIFSEMLMVPASQILIGGNSSLNLMYDTIVRAFLHAMPNCATPWGKLSKVKFLCPVPGYDRHFNICQSLGIEMVNIPMTSNGPDMDMVEQLVSSDSSIRGMWCVPKYSNPTGITYSDEVVNRLAKMSTAADDFRIFWDNAYAVHHLNDNHDQLKDIFTVAKRYDNEDRIFMYASTSKITYAGGGVAAIATSGANLEWFLAQMKNQTIGYDKINQLRHVKFFTKCGGVSKLMERHKKILAPKFNEVDKVLSEALGRDGYYANWNNPNGGYFISYDTLPGCAAKIVEMSSEAGVKLTKAGATFPYGIDLDDRNIRIAPSLPSIAEIHKAISILALVTKIVTLEMKQG